MIIYFCGEESSLKLDSQFHLCLKLESKPLMYVKNWIKQFIYKSQEPPNIGSYTF